MGFNKYLANIIRKGLSALLVLSAFTLEMLPDGIILVSIAPGKEHVYTEAFPYFSYVVLGLGVGYCMPIIILLLTILALVFSLLFLIRGTCRPALCICAILSVAASLVLILTTYSFPTYTTPIEWLVLGIMITVSVISLIPGRSISDS